MTISRKMLDALCGQVAAELHSAQVYLAMSAWCEGKAFKGFARWLRVQFHEEQAHALKLLDHILARGGQPVFAPIEAPRAEYASVLACFEAVQAHERHVTERIHQLHELAVSEKDVASQVFLQWYVTEQVEEEAHVGEIVDRLRLIGDKSSAALYLDKEYGKRQGSAPA